jgi:hypothetical protein
MASQAADPIQQALVEQRDDIVGNSYGAVLQRERDASTTQKHVATLAGENAAARYRKIVLCCPQVTDSEFRLLCLIVEKADGDLKNSFASPAWLQQHLGGRGCSRRPTHKSAANGRRTLRLVYTLIASLEAKGFLRWHRGKGWQLRLPAGVLADAAEAWNGPENWTKRRSKEVTACARS